eukprot:3250252-Rhodomonas_salina.1
MQVVGAREGCRDRQKMLPINADGAKVCSVAACFVRCVLTLAERPGQIRVFRNLSPEQLGDDDDEICTDLHV